MMVELQRLQVALMVARHPGYQVYPWNRLQRIEVLFPDIGLEPRPFNFGFFHYQDEPKPTQFLAAGRVVGHPHGLTIPD